MQETAEITIDNHNKEALIFTDAQLTRMLHLHSADTTLLVPGLRYWVMEENRKMSIHDNICGHQQRAWEYYWAFVLGHQECNIVLGIGTGGVGAPSELTTDKYCGESPDTRRYPEPNGYPNMKLDPDVGDWPFYDNQLGGVIWNHSFEHMEDQEHCLQEAYRVTKEGGCICILQPDIAFNKRGALDPTHTREWAADEFLHWLRTMKGDPEQRRGRIAPEFDADRDIVAHNTLHNDFSFDTVIRVHHG